MKFPDKLLCFLTFFISYFMMRLPCLSFYHLTSLLTGRSVTGAPLLVTGRASCASLICFQPLIFSRITQWSFSRC
ncbi:hypothetical protein NMG60_11003655 [Bertholletia excelsa]